MAPRLLLLFSLLASACGGGPITGDCRTDGCPSPFVCVESMDGAECACPAGTRPEAGTCVALTRCTEDACRMRGTCIEEAAAIRCECEPQFAGVECELCAGGLFDDGMGGCSTDPCAAVTCEGDQQCVVRDGAAACECPAGTHPEGTACVPDTECTANTCAGHGTCELQGTMPACTCDTGWSGARCDGCDASAGYHDDGMGGCTTDVCVPSPCADPHRGVCAPDALGRAACACDPGYHLDLEACVPDEVCEAATCNGNGTCAIVEGLARCTCDAGFAGTRCESCETGYHDDGMGGCTTDVCVPSPCTMPGRGACVDAGGSARCDCDPGLHEDGVGGCTADPCRPDPCAAMNQACRAAGGAAECYTPTCNDNNPCTTDSLAGGVCRYDPLANGTACATSICRTGEACMAGACTGGSAVVCDDSNPCTDDRCEAPLGCRYVADDTNVPDDGLACTIDTCSASVRSHSPSDARCDDAAWCTGVERCMPGPSADARGCVVTSVPAPPGPSGPCSSWTCDEPNDRFVRSDRPEGSSCDDTIRCTSGDACRSGSCRGTPTLDCGSTTCTSTTTLSTLSIDVAAAHVSGSLVHLGSSTFPGSGASNTVSIYLRSRSTGIHHSLERVAFGSWNGTAYPVSNFNETDDRVLDLSVLPGVYDVVYYRNAASDFVARTSNADPYPFAQHVLQTDIVIGPGENVLTIDVGATRVTGSLTHAGSSTFPGSGASNTVSVYLRSRSTGIHHSLERVAFGSWNGTAYPVSSFNETDDRTIDLAVLPGAYDVVYYRNAADDFLARTSNADPYPFARHVLRENVIVGPGPTTLDLDLAASRVTGALTHAGSSTFPGSGASNTVSVYLRSRSTGIHHSIERVAFGSWNGTAYPASSFNETDDRAIDLAVLPGTYDVVYYRNAADDFLARTSNADPYPFARHVLRENVVIGPGATSLDLDLAASRVTGALTHAGSSTFPGSGASNTVSVYLRSRSTGIHHSLERVAFGSWNGAAYPASSFNETDDRAIDLAVLPGTYDLVYYRNAADDFLARTSNADPYPFARHVLRENVVIGPGPSTLGLDLAATRVTGTLTHAGSSTFPGSGASNTVSVYLRSRSTGIHHSLERVAFGSWNGAAYPASSFNETDDRAIDLVVLPGTYDVVYYRNAASDFIARTSSTDPYPFAQHVLREGLVIGPSATSVTIDVGARATTGALVFAGSSTFPGSSASNTVSIYLRSRSTGLHHALERVAFGSWNGTAYPASTFNESDDRAVDLEVLPGTYDLVYYRNAADDFLARTSDADPYPFARHVLASCVVLE